MKFFAIIDSRQQGPFTLDELADAGVRPDTYVWCKGMDGWRKARNVADVCRYWRCRLAGVADPAAAPVLPAKAETEADAPADIPPTLRTLRSFDPEGPEPGVNQEEPPRPMMALALMTCILCCPPTGIAAIFFAAKSRALWQQAEKAADADAPRLRSEAHDAARSAKMWTGISFFLGFIIWAAVSFTNTR